MKDSLRPGLGHVLTFPVPATKTVPALYPEAPEFQAMPEVFATGFLVGLLEWACVQLVNPHLDWPAEQTLGTHVDVSHAAATPPGLTVTVTAHLTAVQGRRLSFAVEAHDDVDLISHGTDQRAVIDHAWFDAKAYANRGLSCSWIEPTLQRPRPGCTGVTTSGRTSSGTSLLRPPGSVKRRT